MSGPALRDEGALRVALVTGGAGFIGSHLVAGLASAGFHVRVLDDLSTGHRSAVTGQFVEADLADRDRLTEVFEEWRPRSVIHFAAKCYVGESVEQRRGVGPPAGR